VATEERFGIDDLAGLGGVTRRTVRYYVQEGLLPPPLGVGRGPHYDRTHLDRLLLVRRLQEDGKTLDEIRAVLAGSPATSATPAPGVPAPARSLWRRVVLAPGVELHIAQGWRFPSPSRLEELAAWCHAHLTRTDAEGEDDA
jgi:DNA-binding transcriptional MerR regulator